MLFLSKVDYNNPFPLGLIYRRRHTSASNVRWCSTVNGTFKFMWPTTCWVGNNSFCFIYYGLSCMPVAKSETQGLCIIYVNMLFYISQNISTM